MPAPRLPHWYRHAWWLPGVCSTLTLGLTVATLRPSEQNALLMVAILCALPWSLALLLLLDLGQGFADRAATIVCVGLFVNALLLWWFTALLRARWLERSRPGPRFDL